MMIRFTRFCNNISNLHIIEVSNTMEIRFCLLYKMVIIAFAYKFFWKN